MTTTDDTSSERISQLASTLLVLAYISYMRGMRGAKGVRECERLRTQFEKRIRALVMAETKR